MTAPTHDGLVARIKALESQHARSLYILGFFRSPELYAPARLVEIVTPLARAHSTAIETALAKAPPPPSAPEPA